MSLSPQNINHPFIEVLMRYYMAMDVLAAV